MVVVSADALQKEGANINVELSWERTAEDFVTELHTYQFLQQLALFRHLIVRIGVCGAIYSHGLGRNSEHRLFYHPTVDEENFINLNTDTTIGNNKLFIASVIEAIVKARRTRSDRGLRDMDVDRFMEDAIRLSVLRCFDQFASRYSISSDDISDTPLPATRLNAALTSPDNQPRSLFLRGHALEHLRESQIREIQNGSQHEPLSVPYIADSRIPIGTASWSILSESSEFDLVQVAEQIVRHGVDTALNSAPKNRSEHLIETLAGKLSKDSQYISNTPLLPRLEAVFERFPEDRDIPDRPAVQILTALKAALIRIREKAKNASATSKKKGRPFRAATKVLDSKVPDKSLSDLTEAAADLEDHFFRQREGEELERLKEQVDAQGFWPGRGMNWEQGILFLVFNEVALQTHAELDLARDEYGNTRSVFAPVTKFDNMIVVDRTEIESLRSVRNLIKRYLDPEEEHMFGDKQRPLSIAVFGPPGSGKSFAVEAILKSLGGDRKQTQNFVYNLSQMNSPDRLMKAIADAKKQTKKEEDALNQKKKKEAPVAHTADEKLVPVIFFDEFDSKLGGEPLGWLKYFLSPMEDGEYLEGDSSEPLGKAIFVFAGGTTTTYTGFCRETASEDDRVTFSNAKGPDFVSRLMGHINIVGINPEGAADEGYVIRRAIYIQSLLTERRLFDSPDTVQASNTAHDPHVQDVIDEDLLNALLRVSRYKHGGRSIRSILSMCTPVDNKIRRSSLPTVDQLRMHVNPKEIFDLLSASSRSNPIPSSAGRHS